MWYIVSCDNTHDDNTKDFNDLTSRFYEIEETNRIDLSNAIEGFNIIPSDTPNLFNDIMSLNNYLNTVISDLLEEAGGYYHEDAHLYEGLEKGEGIKVLRDHKFIENLKNIRDNFIKRYGQQNYFVNKLNESLHKFTELDYYDIIENQTISAVYLDVLILQKKLLIIQVEILRDLCNDLYKSED